ncbi:MAG: NAD(P)H-dependent oxidoreductase [[Clostridium] scindens]
MKILMINGTMRKGSTYQVGKLAIEEIMQEGDQLTELFLPKDMPEFCRGCAACIRESETRCLDYLMYMKRFTRMIDEADLLIFTSPVYVMHVSGAMKGSAGSLWIPVHDSPPGGIHVWQAGYLHRYGCRRRHKVCA